LQPESNIESFVVRPPIILSVGQILLKSGSHLVVLSEVLCGVVSLTLLGHFTGPTICYPLSLRCYVRPAISPHNYPHRSPLTVA
jgi:hypothetical protein